MERLIASRFHFCNGFLSFLRKEIKQAKKARKLPCSELFVRERGCLDNPIGFARHTAKNVKKERKPVASLDCLAVSAQTGPEQCG